MQETTGQTDASADTLRGRLKSALAALEPAAHIPRVASAIRALRRVETSLERPPRIGIFGEFNSGKTSLTNILIGHKALPTSVVTSDRGSTLLRYADHPALYAISGDGGRHRLTSAAFQKLIARPALTEIGVPFARLRDYEIVDTVGVSDPALGGLPPARAANSYVHAAVWCTVASQAWKRTEISQWRSMPQSVRSRSLLVVTHIDAVREPRDREKIAERIRAEAANLFHGFVMVSLTQALQALSPDGEIADHTAWYNSGAADLQDWFAEIVAMARADKQRRAMTSTRAIAERLMSAPLRSAHEIAVAHLAMAWSHRVQRMVHDQARGTALSGLRVEDHAAALTAAARGFSAYSLEPWLEQRMKPAAMRGILALLPSDPKHVLSAVEGLDPDAAHLMLRLIAEQVEAELRETLMSLPPRGEDMPSELPDAVRDAAGALAVWIAAAQDHSRV
jgi:hypothetical protein